MNRSDRCSPPWRLLALALALFGLASAALAQQTTRFDPQRHLDGFSEVLVSEHLTLYRLDEFQRINGHVLSTARLDEVRRAWREERERVAALLDRFRREPRAYVLYRLERDLLQHPAFSRVRLETYPSHDPFVFLLQAPTTARPGYQEEILDALGPDLLRLRELFRAELAGPLGLAERKEFAAYPVIVLNSAQEYARYARTLDGPALFFAQANYDAALRAVVCYVEADARPGADPTLRRPVVHEAALALLDGHAQAEERRPEPWLDEGVASWLSSRAVLRAQDPERPDDGLVRQALVAVAADAAHRSAYLLPLDELAVLHDYAQVYERMLRQASASGAGEPDYPTALLALYGQGGAWTWFLNRPQEGALREGFRGYLALSLADRGGADALRRSFPGTELGLLNESFRGWLAGSVEAWKGEIEAARYDVEASFRLSDVTESTLRREVEQRVQTLEQLAPARDEPSVRFALALRDAVQGRYDRAAQAVQVLLAERPDDPVAPRARRELERLNAFREERLAFLRLLQQSGQKLNLMLPEGRLLATVLAVEDERAVLGENKAGLDAIELDDVDPLQLAKLMRTSRYGFPRGWIQVYPAVLGASEDRDRLLAGESGAGAHALAQDVERRDYEGWLAMADTVDILVALSEAGLPEREDEARTCVGRVQRLLAEHGSLDIVRVRHPALLELAHRAQSLLFEKDGLPEVLHGKLEDLGDGRVRLSYDFDDPAQGQDFEPVAYLDAQRWKDSPKAEDSTPFHVADGVLAARGAVCSRHLLEFDGPQIVRLRYVFRTPREAFDNRIRSLLGICDDRSQSYVAADLQGGLTIADRGATYLQQVDAQGQVFMDTEHAIELVHDGAERVRTSFDGQPAAEASCGPRLAGGLFLWVNSECAYEVVSLEIESRITPASLRGLRQEWVLERLKALGL